MSTTVTPEATVGLVKEDPPDNRILECALNFAVKVRAPRHCDHLFHAIVITHSTAS